MGFVSAGVLLMSEAGMETEINEGDGSGVVPDRHAEVLPFDLHLNRSKLPGTSGPQYLPSTEYHAKSSDI